MSDQLQFDLLRQTCSAALQLLVAATHETELQMLILCLPVGLDTARRFSRQRQVEVQAHEAYIVASRHLADFVQQHLYIVN